METLLGRAVRETDAKKAALGMELAQQLFRMKPGKLVQQSKNRRSRRSPR